MQKGENIPVQEADSQPSIVGSRCVGLSRMSWPRVLCARYEDNRYTLMQTCDNN